MLEFLDKCAIIKLKLEGKSDRWIGRNTPFDRKTVAKYWDEYQSQLEELGNSNDIRSVQEKILAKPKYDTSKRKPVKYTEEIDAELDAILENEREKARLLGENNKQKLTNIQIHRIIVDKGFDIGITVISDHVRIKRQKKKEAFIRQEHELGARLEYDFGEIKLVIGRKVGKYHLAVFGAPAGKFRWAYLYRNERKEVFVDSHVRFFAMVCGVYVELVYDNMRNVVAKFIGRNEKSLNKDLIKMSLYYGFNINVTNCFRGNEKGYVESSVKKMQSDVFGPRYNFETFEEAEQYLEKELIRLNIESLIEEEMKHLLPERPPLEIAKISENTVDKYSFVRVDNNFYSVPDYLVGRKVTVKNYPAEIVVYSGMNEVCRHVKKYGFREESVNILHYLDTLSRKPGALKNSKALKSKQELKIIFDKYFIKKPRKFIALLKEHNDKPMDDIVRILEYAGANADTPQDQVLSDISDSVLDYTLAQISATSDFFMNGGERLEH